MPTGYAAANVPLSSASMSGIGVEVTRRFLPTLECGILAWLAGASSDGKGTYAHGLTRFVGEARFVPWALARIEPWIGAEAGFMLADDFATWDATATASAHQVSSTRFGHVEGLSLGTRARLTRGIALDARGGLLLVGFPKATTEHEPGDTTGMYVVRPTDYRTRPWYSFMLSAEITVSD
jgi:hypothetical protein